MSRKLWAISDLHVAYPANREILTALPEFRDDWLIVAGDVGETADHLAWTFETLCPRFAKVLWTPGNHELWTRPDEDGGARGEALYGALRAVCARYGVVTPEDPYPLWTGPGGPCVVAPTFTLYDYTFRPDDVPASHALDWAAEAGLLCADEHYLHPDPYPTREAWCAARVAHTEARLEAETDGLPTVLINHFPLRYDLVRLKRIPRFSIWCGTRATEDWHLRFRARVVVSGHLHVPRTEWRDGVRCEEVSLCYPRQRRTEKAPHEYLREILPGRL